MSLSDRLKKAKTQRLIAAGVLSSEHALKPEPTTEEPDEPVQLFTPITIEVSPTGLHPVSEAPIDLGEVTTNDATTSCPNCNGRAHLDMVDLVGHTNHYTCETCGTMWQTHLPSSDNLSR